MIIDISPLIIWQYLLFKHCLSVNLILRICGKYGSIYVDIMNIFLFDVFFSHFPIIWQIFFFFILNYINLIN